MLDRVEAGRHGWRLDTKVEIGGVRGYLHRLAFLFREPGFAVQSAGLSYFRGYAISASWPGSLVLVRVRALDHWRNPRRVYRRHLLDMTR